ncbi:BnaA02g35300D [Brassica napus]|uniref:BnaA02g35300D protein n=1 Tax=Brassica napus TaxID=3708 RepID=A0A078J673_BRANA|nr:BnaA02g35300D [Brassica napus]
MALVLNRILKLHAWWEMLDKCFMSNHLVESPSGELFFIKWYTLCIRRGW